MERLEREREVQIETLKQKHEAEAAEVEKLRKAEEEELAVQRRKEEDELAARRKREDEERQARIAEQGRTRLERKQAEDAKRAKEAEEKRRMVHEQMEKEMERLEDDMEQRVEEGKKMLMGLDEQRKAINAKIDAAMNTPTVIPTVKFRSRAKTSALGGTDKEAATLSGSRRHTEASMNGSDVKGLGQTMASTDIPLGRKLPIVNGIEQIPQNGEPTSRASQILPPEAHLGLPIQHETTKKQPSLEAFDTAESSVPEHPSRIRSASVAKAWWDTHQLASMTAPQGEESQHDEVHLVETPAADTQMGDLSKLEKEALHSWVVGNGDVSKPTTTEDDPEDLRTREEVAQLNAELLNNRDGVHQSRPAQDNALATSDHLEKPTTTLDKFSTGLSKAEAGSFHFYESDRPAPSFNDTSAFESSLPRYQYSESNRPLPTFTHRWTESNRSKPQLNLTPAVYKVFRFLEPDRPLFGDKITQTNMFPQGVFHWTEDQRRAPHFEAASDGHKVFNFKESQRPSPSFVFHWTEDLRPKPHLTDTPTVFKTYNFLEGDRHSYSQGDSGRPIHADNANVVTGILPRVFRFQEQNRPQPHFVDSLEEDLITFRFAEGNRPQPNIIHRYFESCRPAPRFDESTQQFRTYNWLEGDRPVPFPVVTSSTGTSASLKNPTIQGAHGVFHYFEANRPKPTFTDDLSAFSKTFRFGEQSRPSPCFIYQYPESRRPAPVFDDAVVAVPHTYHYLEAERPIPLSASHIIAIESNVVLGPKVASGGNRPRMPVSFSSNSTTNAPESNDIRVPQNRTSGFPDFQDDENDYAAPEKLQRKSGVFASLVDVFKSEVPLVNRLRSQTYNSVPEDDHDPYSDEVYENDIEHDMELPRHAQRTEEAMHSDWQFNERSADSEEEFPLRSSSNSLRVRTDTVATVSSFEEHSHSDDEESPATPSDAASSPFLGSPEVQSWSPPRRELHHEHIPGIKPQASPQRADFEQTYPNYVTPKPNVTDLAVAESNSTRSSITNGSGETQDQPHLSTSATPSPSRIPRRPTISSRGTMGPTPANSPSVSTPPTQTSLFQKRRSLFEAPAQSPSQSTSSSIKSRPTSLIQSQPGDDLITPRSLDGNNKPPSPTFTLPPKHQSQGGGHSGPLNPPKANPFLDGLSKLVAAGSGGLENSIHNPARFEKERLLADGKEGY